MHGKHCRHDFPTAEHPLARPQQSKKKEISAGTRISNSTK
jgi:hypothetical protein